MAKTDSNFCKVFYALLASSQQLSATAVVPNFAVFSKSSEKKFGRANVFILFFIAKS